MRLHVDTSVRVAVDSGALAWVASPEPGVERRMLERDGGEVARATSVVRYGAGTRFARHEHGRGEEILVLDGIFSDEHGDYPTGTYLRNPWGSAHAPFSVAGCTLFVKLRWMQADDRQRVVCRLVPPSAAPGQLSFAPLHRFADEEVELERWGPGSTATHEHRGGEELFVLEGELEDELGIYPTGTWLRHPAGSRHTLASPSGALVFAKRGHLSLPGP